MFVKDEKKCKILNISKIKGSYTNKSLVWKEYKDTEEDVYLFRISKRIPPNVKKLIKNEYEIHKENESLNNISPEFLCFYLSDFLNFSVFKFKDYKTLEELIKDKIFSKKDLLKATSETVSILNLDEKFYICPFIMPSNVLYTEESGSDYFYLAEIFLETDSDDKELEVELPDINEYLVPEFEKKKTKITFSSNICCLGYLFYNIFFKKPPFKDEKSRKLEKIPKIQKEFEYKDLILNSVKSNYKERWSIDDIKQYIDDNILEEKENNEEMEQEDKKDEEEDEDNRNNKNKNEIKKDNVNDNDNDNANIAQRDNENKEKELNDKNISKSNKEIMDVNVVLKDNLNEQENKNGEEENEEQEKILKEEKEKLLKQIKEMEQMELERKKKEKEEKEKLEKERIEKEKKKKEEEEKRIEDERKKEEDRKERQRINEAKLEEERKLIEKLKEEIEKRKKEEKEIIEKEKKEKESIEKERIEKERIEKERIEKERIEKERLEKERIEKERIEKERLEKQEKERKRKEKELEEIRKKEEERKEKERKEKERKEQEIKQAQNFPNGISSRNTEIGENIKFIHLEIKFKSEVKDIEVFDIYAPSKQGYKVIKYENNKYFVVFPFYKTKTKHVFFGIRDIKTKEFVDKKYIFENENFNYFYSDNEPKNRYSLFIIKEKSEFMIFNIYNVPKEINKISYLKFIHDLNLKDYKFTESCIKEVTSILTYSEILDLILEFGNNNLSQILINILNKRKIDIYQIAYYLEKNKKKFDESKFYSITPIIIYDLFLDEENKKNKEEENNNLDEENEKGKRNCLLCCDKNVPVNLYSENYIKELIPNTIQSLGNIFIEENKLNEIRENIKKKLTNYNNNQRSKGLKEITCILTDTTVKKIFQLELGIKANIAMIIQGFTSAGKSFLSNVASHINNRECLSTALSEHTTIEDLLGRDIIKENSSITFIPGILLIAYIEGKTLILDECDLAKPEILSCILGSISKNELIVNNKIYRKMNGYNIILTMNGEVKGFNEKQRNILTSNILSKFIIIPFDEMEKTECEEIFKTLLKNNENSRDYIRKADSFIELHQKMIDEMKNNKKSIDSIVTLRNLKYCYYLNKNNVSPRDAAEISYTARFPKNERKDFERLLKKFGDFEIKIRLKNEIINELKKIFYFIMNHI